MLAEKLVGSSEWPRMHGSSPKLKKLRGLDLVEREFGTVLEPCNLEDEV